jgi:hypothetical protein
VTAVWRDGRWTEFGGPLRRSFGARIASKILLIAAICMLYLSPRATAVVLAFLKGLEGALRPALLRGFRQRETVPPETR